MTENTSVFGDKASVLEALRSHTTLLLTSHIYPDGDNIGSLLALGMGLKALGKRVYLTLDDVVPRIYRFLPGQEMLILLEQVPPDFTLAVVLDASDSERIGRVSRLILPAVPVVNIDHHISNTGFGQYRYVDTTAAATGEIVHELLGELGVAISPAIAVNLYTAILTDSGSFRYSNTTPRTHRIAAELLACGLDPSIIAEQVFETRSLASVRLLGKALETLEMDANGAVAWLTVTEELLQATGALADETEGLVNYPRSIEGVEVAILFKDYGQKGIKVSLRSRRTVDVSRIALALGGGGHARASGCVLPGPLAAAKARVLEAVRAAVQGG